MTSDGWDFNDSVENETKFKPLCQQVEAQLTLPPRRLYRYFGISDDPWLLRCCGKNFRGLHVPFAGRTMLPIDVLHCFFLPLIDLSPNMTFEETIAFDNLIYVRASTCADKTGFVTTYAHELQHFVQHGTLPRMSSVNNVLYENLKRLEPSSIVTDIPSERDANIVSKQVAEIVCGVEEVRRFAAERVAFMGRAGEPDEKARWEFFRDVPTSNKYDYQADTLRLVEKYKAVLDFGMDVNEHEWWLGPL